MPFIDQFSSDQAPIPFPNGTAVLDDAFPDQRGIVIGGGPEHSDVAFGGGLIRSRPNSCLRKVDEGQQEPAAEIIPPTGSTESVETLIAAISKAHERVIEAGLDLLVAAMDAGDALKKLKKLVGKLVGHGKFGACLKRCEITARTAQVYMQLAENRPKIAAYFAPDEMRSSAAHLSLRAALKLIAKKPDPPEPANSDNTNANNSGSGAAESNAEPGNAESDVGGNPPESDAEPDTDRGGFGPYGFGEPLSPLRNYWPMATIEERRELLEAVPLDELLAVLPTHLRRGLTERLAGLNGQRRSPQLTNLIKTAIRSRRPAEQISALGKFASALGDDLFEVRVRAPK
jgi:hypothetical protein